MILNTVETGAGAPLVLLHGLMGAAQNWGGIARRLGQKRLVLAMDARNHGASGHAAGMDYATLAGDVAQTLAARGIGSAAVLGHSMGGKIAMMLALTRPALVDRLVVADMAPVRYDAPSRAYVLAMQAMALPAGLTRREAMAALEPAEPAEAIRGFLLQNLIFGDGAPHWRIGLDEIAAGMPEIEDFAPPSRRKLRRPDAVHPRHPQRLCDAGSDAGHRRAVPAGAHAAVDAAHWVHSENPNAFLAALEPFLEA